MSAVVRKWVLIGAIACLSCGLMAVTTDAQARVGTHHVTKKHKKARGDSKLRIAQTHLANLGFYKGRVDGLNGPKTRNAIKAFQRAHGLRVTGKLTTQTYNAILAADRSKAMSSLPIPPMPSSLPTGTPEFYTNHPDFYGYYDQAYENAGILGFPQNVSSRFARLELSERIDGSPKRYAITLNGQPLLTVDGQPSVIGISRTFNLGSEDAIILTSYRDGNLDCSYEHHLLILSESGSSIKDIRNCTRGYQAKVSNNSLFVTFPETDDQRDVGATWRYEKGDLERL